MDKRILLTVFFIIVIVGGILVFNMLNKDCAAPTIVVNTARPEEGKTIEFSGESESEDNIVWNFGDGTPGSSGNNVSHTYSSGGHYVVIAKSGECETPKDVFVSKKRDTSIVRPLVRIPADIYANEKVVFRDETRDASHWSWHILETGESGTSSSFNTVFKKQGKYTVTLAMKGDYLKGDTSFAVNVVLPKPVKRVVTHYVAPRPPPPPVVKPPPPKRENNDYWDNAQFRMNFTEIANSLSDESSNASERWKEVVKQCCVNNSLTISWVSGTGNPRNVTLEEFKKMILAQGGFYVTDVQITGGGKGNCVNSIRVVTKDN